MFATSRTSLSDSSGLVASPTMNANGVISSYIATASTPGVSDLKLTMNNAAPTVQSVVIQQGAAGRSFIRYVDLTISDFGTVASIVKSVSGKTPRISITNTGLAGTAKTVVALKGLVTTNGDQIHIDFGSKGLGSNAASNAADGSYLISLDLNGNVSLETTQRFLRLLGDVNGDKVVDTTDTVIVNTKPNKNGKVNSTNVTYVKNPQTVNHDLILGVIQGAPQSMAKLSGSVLGLELGFGQITDCLNVAVSVLGL